MMLSNHVGVEEETDFVIVFCILMLFNQMYMNYYKSIHNIKR